MNLILSVLVALSFREADSDLVHFEKCHSNGKNDIVQAYNHFYPPMRSCKSSSICNKKEVHVFRAYSPQSSYSTAINGDHVKLYLEKISYDNVTMVLVLSSDVSLTWNLVLPDRMKWNVMVWYSDNTKLKNNKAKTMPFDDRGNLSDWLKKECGIVSSHVEVALPVNVVHLDLERGYGKQCNLTENKSQKIAFRKQDAVILNCIFHTETSAMQHRSKIRKDVHIVEFHSMPSGARSTNSSAKQVVVLHLKTRRSFKSVEASIIIKTDLEVIFKVKMGSSGGRISIHTNQEISNDAVHKQVLVVSAENFDGMSSEELYEWTKLHHGLPITFSKIFEANFVEILIGSEVPGPSSKVMDAPLHHSPQPHDLSNGVNVVCHAEFFSVAVVKKPDLLSCDWLTLSDERCRAQSNHTHCVIDSKYGQCRACTKDGIAKEGEDCYGDDDRDRYRNEILIHNIDNDNKTNGSDASLHTIPLDCSESSIFVNNNNNINNNNNNDNIMGNTDKKDVYFKLLVHFEDHSKVKVDGQVQGQSARKFFVEAVVEPEGSMIAIVEDCRLESTTPWKIGYIHHLVRKRCPVGSVEWQRFPTKEKPVPVVFSFLLDDHVVVVGNQNGSDTFWRVVCKVSPCFVGEDMSATDIPQCSDEDYDKCEHDSFSASRPSLSSARLSVNVSSHPLPSRDDQSEHLKRGRVTGDEEGHRLKDRIFQMVLGGEDPIDGDLESQACTKGHPHLGEYVTMEIGIAVSFFAFLIGIISMSAFWLIYAKTRPKKLIGSKHLRSPDTSGESTPSSTSPITICQIKRSK